MGLFDDIEAKPEGIDESPISANRELRSKQEINPETVEDVMTVKRALRKDIESEEGFRFGTPTDLAEQFNNTLIGAIGGSVDAVTWAMNKGSNAVFGKDLVDPETAFLGSAQLKRVLNPIGIGSEEAPDSFMGYTGQTFGEAATFLAGGAAIASKAKQAKGVVGAIAKEADTALKTKLDAVVAVEGITAAGMAAGREIADNQEMGTTGTLLTEFATGALAIVSASAAKKTLLDPLTAKLKNMTPKEALEKLSKEEVAEVVAEGQRVIAKEEPTPAPKTPSDGRTIYRAENVGQTDDGLGLPFYTEDKTYADLYMGEGRVLKEAQIPKNVVDIRQPEGRAKVREWAETKIKDLEEDGHTDDFLRGAKKVLNEDSPEASARLLANLTLSINKQAGRGLGPSGVAERQFLTETGNSAMTMKESGREIDEYSYAILPEKVKTPATPAEPTPAPKTPEAAPKADPTSASEDPIDIAIKETRDILTGDRSGGKGAQVTRRVKKLFRQVAREFHDDISDLIKTGDVAVAKKILARIDKYIEFDRVISEKDYAQGSELVANRKNAMEFEFRAGISAAGNKRTEDLTVLKGMLQKFADEGVEVADDALKGAKADAKKSSEGAPKLTKEEKLDAVADQVAKTFVGHRQGVFQEVYDAYFNTRLVQMLNQAKTAFVGVPSATIMSVVRPIINTPYNIRKSLSLKGVSTSRRLQYAAADITATYEYVRMVSKHLGDTLRSSKDTILNKGDSNFLYRDRNAYIKDELAQANEPTHAVKRRLKQAERRVAAQNAETPTGKAILGAKAKVMNSKLAQIPAFFFDYGVSLIGGLEEISLVAHSMRAARAQGIKKAIDDGADDVWKASEDFMEGAIDRSRGGIQANYDPEYADVFNTARRDHFRAMDLDPNDIRKDVIDGMVAGLARISNNPDELGTLAKMLFVFIGVPMRALGANVSYIAAPYNVAKGVAGKGTSAIEKALGGTATFGKFNKKISEIELDIKGQKKLLKSEDPEVAKSAEKKLAELEESHAFHKDLQMQEDYENIGKLAVGAGMFFLGYEMAKNGQVAGTDSWMTEDQKMAVQKVQGAPNSWKVVLGGYEMDFKYMEPLKGVFALGADYARRQAAEDAGALTEDQTMTQFATSVAKSIATDSPFATGARYMTQIMSPNPETQERGVMGVGRSLIPVPAEIRNFNKFDEELVTDTTAGNGFETMLKASLGQETGNYRLTVLGEPKIKEEPTLASYLMAFAPKKVAEREPIDDILLEDAMSFKSVTEPQRSVGGFKLMNYVNEENETAYSLYGRLISETRLNGKTQRQALNQLVKTAKFKNAYKKGYEQNEQGTEVNEGVEMIKEIIQEYRASARKKLLESRTASEYTDGDGNNIYDVMREREAFSERPDSLLETLNLQ